MGKGQPLGLDELMIVNPAPPKSGGLVLGDEAVGRFFLGEDGTVYQVQGFAPSGLAEHAEGLDEEDGGELGRFFLGEDGALYEIVT